MNKEMKKTEEITKEKTEEITEDKKEEKGGRLLRPRQRILLQKLSENLRSAKPRSLQVLCKESGFSESASKSPSRILKTESFQRALVESGLDTSLVVKEYQKALQEKPHGKISWAEKRKYLADLVAFLDIAPKEEKWSRMSSFEAKIQELYEDEDEERGEGIEGIEEAEDIEEAEIKEDK